MRVSGLRHGRMSLEVASKSSAKLLSSIETRQHDEVGQNLKTHDVWRDCCYSANLPWPRLLTIIFTLIFRSVTIEASFAFAITCSADRHRSRSRFTYDHNLSHPTCRRRDEDQADKPNDYCSIRSLQASDSDRRPSKMLIDGPE